MMQFPSGYPECDSTRNFRALHEYLADFMGNKYMFQRDFKNGRPGGSFILEEK